MHRCVQPPQIMFLATGTRHRGCGFARLLTSCIMWAASRAEHQVCVGVCARPLA